MFYMHFFNYTMLLLSATDLTVNVIPIPKLNHFFFFSLHNNKLYNICYVIKV